MTATELVPLAHLPGRRLPGCDWEVRYVEVDVDGGGWLASGTRSSPEILAEAEITPDADGMVEVQAPEPEPPSAGELRNALIVLEAWEADGYDEAVRKGGPIHTGQSLANGWGDFPDMLRPAIHACRAALAERGAR